MLHTTFYIPQKDMSKDQKEEILATQATEESADEKILRLETELKDANEKYLRVLAEEQNLIKRQSLEKEEFVRYANQEIITEFISVYDHLKLSIGSLPDNEKASAWVQGVEYTVKQFKDLLSVNGVDEIKTAGVEFNPAEMEAIEGVGEKVAKEIMPGYKLNGKVIRAARVTLE
jgi:molecular chaperone GrpE